MPYKVRLKNINPDFTFVPPPESSWSDEMADDAALIFLMNRVAVAGYGDESIVEFPEIEIIYGNKRVTVTTVHGQLIYNDPHLPNQQNLKIVPEELIRLLADKPLKEVSREPVRDAGPEVRYQEQSSWGKVFSGVAVLCMLAIWFVCGRIIYRELSYRPTLIQPHWFIHNAEGQKSLLHKYSGVYVSDYRDGGKVFQILENGKFESYEMWYSRGRNRFILVEQESLPLLIGSQDGKLAFLAGTVHLLLPEDTRTFYLHGDLYRRHNGALNDIGQVIGSNQL